MNPGSLSKAAPSPTPSAIAPKIHTVRYRSRKDRRLRGAAEVIAVEVIRVHSLGVLPVFDEALKTSASPHAIKLHERRTSKSVPAGHLRASV